MISRILTAVLLVLTVVGAVAAFRLIEATLAADVYRERLVQLATDYETLLGSYNAAVRRTAITELVVEGDTLSVVIRTAVREGDRMSVGAGGAIVLASDPDAEVAEKQLKADAVLGAFT